MLWSQHWLISPCWLGSAVGSQTPKITRKSPSEVEKGCCQSRRRGCKERLWVANKSEQGCLGCIIIKSTATPEQQSGGTDESWGNNCVLQEARSEVSYRWVEVSRMWTQNLLGHHRFFTIAFDAPVKNILFDPLCIVDVFLMKIFDDNDDNFGGPFLSQVLITTFYDNFRWQF